jgi:hypothetical protein
MFLHYRLTLFQLFPCQRHILMFQKCVYFIPEIKAFWFLVYFIVFKNLLIGRIPIHPFHVLYSCSEWVFCMEVKILLCLHFATFMTNYFTFSFTLSGKKLLAFLQNHYLHIIKVIRQKFAVSKEIKKNICFWGIMCFKKIQYHSFFLSLII